MASQVSGGATKAITASSDTMANKPAKSSQSAEGNGLLAALEGMGAGDPDVAETCWFFPANSAKDHARIDAASQAAATAPRVRSEPTLRSSVVTAIQTPHNVAETRKLVRQSCPRRRRASQEPEKARKGRRTEVLLISSMMDCQHDPVAVKVI